MYSFSMNNRLWRLEFVDCASPMLVDRTNRRTVATTDPVMGTVYLSNRLEDDYLTRVLIHELGHCALVSFNLLDDIHRFVYPEYWVEAEEWVCNFLADYGYYIYNVAYSVLGLSAWEIVPHQLERLIA